MSTAGWSAAARAAAGRTALASALIAGAQNLPQLLLYRACTDAGYIIGPLFLGWLTARAGFTSPLLLTAAMFIISGVLFALLAPETHRTG
jgi:hypothetical protein